MVKEILHRKRQAPRQVPLEECGELLARFQELTGDSRVSPVACEGNINRSPLAFMRDGTAKMIEASRQKGYLTGTQERTIESTVSLYDSVTALNDSYQPRFRDGVAGLFTELADVAGQVYDDSTYPYGIIRAIDRLLDPLEAMTERIGQGELFWDFHFHPAMRMIEALEDVDLGSLGERIVKAKDRVSLAKS